LVAEYLGCSRISGLQDIGVVGREEPKDVKCFVSGSKKKNIEYFLEAPRQFVAVYLL